MRNHETPPASAVGTVVRTGPRGVLVVETKGRAVDLGTYVVTEDGQHVGAVVDLIGPVRAPFAVVAPPRKGKGRYAKRRRGPNPASLVGGTLYAR